MLQLLRYIRDDIIAYVATAGMLIGVFTAFFPPIAPKMPPSYGCWIVGISGTVFLYRAGKAAILFRFGKRAEPRIAEYNRSYKGSKLTYYFSHEMAKDDKVERSIFHGKWHAYPQDRELSIAYWEPYPSFHIAYWNYNSINRSRHEEVDLNDNPPR